MNNITIELMAKKIYRVCQTEAKKRGDSSYHEKYENIPNDKRMYYKAMARFILNDNTIKTCVLERDAIALINMANKISRNFKFKVNPELVLNLIIELIK